MCRTLAICPPTLLGGFRAKDPSLSFGAITTDLTIRLIFNPRASFQCIIKKHGYFDLFGYNSRGVSFEVEQTCAKLQTPVKCGVTFNQSNVVVAMGSFNLKTKFVPDADIAGVGVSLCNFHSL